MIQLTNYNPEAVKKLPKIIGFPVVEEQPKVTTPKIEERLAQLPISVPASPASIASANPIEKNIADLKYEINPVTSNQPVSPVNQPVTQPIASAVNQPINQPFSLPLTGPLTDDELSLVRRLLNRETGGALVNKV